MFFTQFYLNSNGICKKGCAGLLHSILIYLIYAWNVRFTSLVDIGRDEWNKLQNILLYENVKSS